MPFVSQGKARYEEESKAPAGGQRYKGSRHVKGAGETPAVRNGEIILRVRREKNSVAIEVSICTLAGG
jgi:hypothetical protein